MSEQEHVILVDENDQKLGLYPKLLAHQQGLLHRAFSIFIFNNKNQLMLHQRNKEKYHSGGLWSNTCCSHPREGESIAEAAQRRLVEEMGFKTQLTEMFSFIYKQQIDNGLIEHEFDHVLIGYYDLAAKPNPDEVADWRWVELDDLLEDIKRNPNKYTCWFLPALEKLLKMIDKK